jgi:hypothetical protein
MAAAFIEYMDSSAVLLRPGRFPLEGKDARRFISGTDDSGYILTWVPQNVIISKSGDIGYTYGTWTSYSKNGMQIVPPGEHISPFGSDRRLADGK